MATNLQIDDHLLTKAQRVGGLKTKKATVTQALEEYIQRREQAKITELFGTIDYDPDYDYKAARKRR
jgi:Arc/MetJ family transcription regulator